VSAGAATRLAVEAAAVLATHHRDNPLRPGMPLPALATALRVTPAVLERVVAESADLVAAGPVVRRSGFSPRLPGAAQSAWVEARSVLLGAGFSPPRRGELGLDAEVVHALIRAGMLVPVGDDLVYLPETLEQLVTTARTLRDGFVVGDFRDALGITRKHAVPLLEWMDANGITRRSGDVRSFTSG
jgi:selenocysteine-specific elongation factor